MKSHEIFALSVSHRYAASFEETHQVEEEAERSAMSRGSDVSPTETSASSVAPSSPVPRHCKQMGVTPCKQGTGPI